ATGDAEKYESAKLAFEVLSDPDLRKQFNKLKGMEEEEGGPKFSGQPFFDSLGRDNNLRTTLLCILCDRRRIRPFTPSLSMRNIENILQTTPEQLYVAVWYLKQRNLVMNDDKSSLQITVEGIDFLESLNPSPVDIMPFIKPSALAPAAL